MKALVLRELKSIFYSATGAFFALAFLLIMSAMLWAFSGNYNFIDGGHASMNNFFDLAPVLLIVLIPALTMRQFAEEKRNKTLDILMARPLTFSAIYFSKFLASFLFVIFTLLPTLVYVYSLYQLANPAGSIDISGICISYVALILLTAVFVSIGLFASSLTNSQVIAFIVSVILCAFSFYGFNLLAGLFLSGKFQSIFSSVGLSPHYQLMQRGVIQLKDLVVLFNYFFIFSVLAKLVFSRERKRLGIFSVCVLIAVNLILIVIPDTRFDFTSDKRYTLSDYSRKLISEVGVQGKPISVTVYLAGDLNPGFQYLQNATRQLLGDFNRYGGNAFDVSYINPYLYYKSAIQMYDDMVDRDMPGIVLHETDREGKVSQKVIYPYAQVSNGKDTLVVSLLKNIAGNTADENLNASVENLEFGFIDAIRLLNQQKPKSIAFIEGHGELPRVNVYDAEEVLAKYYFVNRGEIGNDINVLNSFDAVIIAAPVNKYTETEKYILDQYIMSGGRVLWLVDGAYYSQEDMAKTGESVSMKNEVNLEDILFSYGVRINGDLIQDRQCASVYLISGDDAQTSTALPCLFRPLLIPSPDSPITKNIRDVKAGFASSINAVNNSPEVRKTVLLTTSADAHIVKVPEKIDFDLERVQNIPDYFDQPYIPVALSLEGIFHSAFANRLTPDSLDLQGHHTIGLGKHTKMIVVSSSDIISNEIQGKGEDTQIVPMGFDRVSQMQYGNRDFIVNAVNWLTDDDGWMALRTKQQQMHILNKKNAYENRDKYMILNIVVPILFVMLIIGGLYLYRKRKYEK